MPTIQSAVPVRHSKFYIDDRKPFVTLLVEGQLFRVHRYIFELESEVFRMMFEIPQGDRRSEGEADETPIILPSVTVPEMEALLNFFYFRPRRELEDPKFSKDDWCNLLSISHRYECEGARKRSIKEINKLGSSVIHVDKIVMAQRFGVDEWLVPACVALVEREDPLTFADAYKLGLEMTVLVSKAREKCIRAQRQGSSSGSIAYASFAGHSTTIYYTQVAPTTTQLVKSVLHIK